MIYHNIQNGGYMFLILCLWTSVTNSTVIENTFTIQEFCSGNLYIHNIEPGEPYKLTLKSETSVSKWYQKSKRKCRQEFKTSDAAAHFVVSISNMSIPSCDNCRCNYFEISVNRQHRKRYCGDNGNSKTVYFASKSDKLSMDFHQKTRTQKFDVSFTFNVLRNSYYITGTPKESSHSSTFIETPYFPDPYPANYKAEYVLQSDDPDSYVLLLFLDFQISQQSFIEVYGNNGTHPTRYYGNIFRPPVIVSQTNRLSLSFVSNDDQIGMSGIRAVSSFIKSIDSLVVPYTDCSDSRDGRGGYINIKTHERFGLYDCVWHIESFNSFAKSNLSVYAQLQNIGYKSILEFRSGSNSKSEIVSKINCETQNCNNLLVEITVPASENLYIRFNGYLDVYSVVNMSYSTYHTGNCSNKEFRCDGGRCLLSDFRCDGIRQCPNGTDEESCPTGNILKDEVSLHPSIQSENFLRDDTYKFVIIVLLGSFGLITVVIIVCIFTYNYCRRNVVTDLYLPQQAVGELSDVQPSMYPVNVYDCDNPPSYEDFIKSSDCYPPLLYTRVKKHFISRDNCMQCTTSFCTGARMRYHSADSFNLRGSDTGSDDVFLNITEDVAHVPQPLSSNQYNVEIIRNNIALKTKNIKRSYSLDSKLNDLVNQDSCHLLLSIVHPVCTHTSNQVPLVQCHTLPPNFRMSAFQSYGNDRPKMNKIHWSNLLDSNNNLPKDRRFTWSFVPRSSVTSEILTVVKARCFSEPCNGISVHCSLY